MRIEIGRFIYESDGTFFTILKNGKTVLNTKIKEMEITYYLPIKKITRYPSIFFVVPDKSVNYSIVNPMDNGEIKEIYIFLIGHGAVEKLEKGAWKGAFKKHSTVEEKITEEKIQKKEAKQRKQEQERAIRAENNLREFKRAGCKVKTEEKYTCTKCGEVWYASTDDILKNVHNATKGTSYNINQVRDLSRCPKCGSRASKHKAVKYWVDKKGNCVDMEE